MRAAVGMLAAALLLIAWLFGGASRLNAWPLAVVELASLPVLVAAVRQLAADGVARANRTALALLGAIALAPLLQLVPLPPAVWTALPGRADLVQALEIAGISPGWAPISLTPDLTWAAFLALLPPAAMFMATLAAGEQDRRRSAMLVVAVTGASLLAGAAQFAAGRAAVYPYATTDAGSIVGLFANRNHLAALVLVAIPFAAVLGASSSSVVRRRTAVAFVVLAITALAVIRSRAGIVLAGPVIAVSMWLVWSRRREVARGAIAGLAAAAAAAVLAVGIFALSPILDRFDRSGAEEFRLKAWPTVVEAASTHQPFGAGLGAFDAVYRSVEPVEDLGPKFFNHAHNEYLELWLEAGLPGLLLLTAIVAWWGRAWLRALRAEPTAEVMLRRAAGVGVLVLMACSVVDYPLRTETLAVILAFLLALLAPFGELQDRPARQSTPRT